MSLPNELVETVFLRGGENLVQFLAMEIGHQTVDSTGQLHVVRCEFFFR